MKLVADSNIPFLKGVFEPFAEVVYLPGDAINESAVRDANALIVRTRTRCDKALLAGSKVRFIATATIGHDHLFADDLAACGRLPGAAPYRPKFTWPAPCSLTTAPSPCQPRFRRGSEEW